MTTHIKGRKESKLITYENKVLENIWKENLFEKNIVKHEKNIEIKIKSLLEEARQYVCIVCDEELPKYILEHINELYNRGVRIYLLTNRLYSTYKHTIVGKVLLRIDETATGTLILIDANENSNFSTGLSISNFSFSVQETHIIPLSGATLKESYHHFIYKFWNDSKLEVRSNKEYENPVIIQNTPFDIFPLLEPQYFIYNDYRERYVDQEIERIISQSKQQLIIGIRNTNFSKRITDLIIEKSNNLNELIIYTDLNDNNLMLINKLNFDNTKVYSTTNFNRTFLLIDGKEGIVLNNDLKGDCFGMKLNALDSVEYLNQINNLSILRQWQYEKSIVLKNIQSEKIILNDTNSGENPIKIKALGEQNLQTKVIENLRELKEGLYKPSFEEPDELVRQVRYHWELTPRQRSADAKKSPLYTQWTDCIQSLTKNSETLLLYIKEAESNLNKVSNIMSRFFKNPLNRTEKLKKEIQSIQMELQKPISLERVKEYNHRLVELQNKVILESLDIKENIEYANALSNWEQQKKKVQEEINTLSEMVHNATSEKQQIEKLLNNNGVEEQQQLEKLEGDLVILKEEKQTFEEIYSDAIKQKEFNEAYVRICALLDNNLKKIGQMKKNKIDTFFKTAVKLVQSEISSIYGKDEYINDLLATTKMKDKKELLIFIKKQFATDEFFKTTKMGDESEDVFEEYNLVEKEISTITEKVYALNKHIKEKNKDIFAEKSRLDKKIGNYNKEQEQLTVRLEKIKEQPEQIKGKFSANDSSLKLIKVKIPLDRLPEAGTLYEIKNERQIAITFWEELDKAEEEAEYFGAKVVVER